MEGSAISCRRPLHLYEVGADSVLIDRGGDTLRSSGSSAATPYENEAVREGNAPSGRFLKLHRYFLTRRPYIVSLLYLPFRRMALYNGTVDKSKIEGMNVIIRKESAFDHDKIYSTVKCAFDSAAHADGNEQDLINELRSGDSYIPELSLVAELDGAIVGHIMFTKAWVGDTPVLALAPLSVRPEHQRKGIGSALVREGHRIAAELGYSYSVVLGSDKYYPKMGYVPADTLGITAPFDVPRENFMACRIRRDAPEVCGTMKYAKEFGIA